MRRFMLAVPAATLLSLAVAGTRYSRRTAASTTSPMAPVSAP